MKRFLLCLFQFLICTVAFPAMTFVHPGAMNSQTELDFVKAKIAVGAEPWTAQFNKVKVIATGGTNALVTVNSNNNTEANTSKSEARKAYANALAWAYTGNETYARQAIAVLNAWSGFQGFTGGSDQDKLQAGWIGALFAPAAEIMLGYSGWAPTDVAKVRAMFKRAFYPYLNTASSWNGNVDLTQIDAMMNMAVFNEDETEFLAGLARLKKRDPSYFYLASDGGVPPISGDGNDIPKFWSYPLKWVDGLTQETCRDNNHHAQYAMASAFHAAEVAWHQGVDVYTANTARYTAVLELMATQIVTGDMQGTSADPKTTANRFATFEVGYNHYHNRMGIALPNTLRALTQEIRPKGQSDWNIFFETLTHADLAPPAPTTIAPVFAAQPAAQIVLAGLSATYAASATGTPTPSYQWQLLPVGSGTWANVSDGGNYSGATITTLTVSNTTTGMIGDQFRCLATNSAGSATSNAATLTVNAAPVITTQPASQTIIAGNSVTFTGAASGAPTPTYQWRKGGVGISGATNRSYTIATVVSGDAGSYTVVATNAVSTATSVSATLTVNIVPIFTTQPLSLPAFAGATINFSAAATSTTAISYQWQKGGINIPGATGPTFSLSNVQLTDAGSYAVVATDSVGSATSRFARLVVLVSQSNAITYATTVSAASVTAGGAVNLAYYMTNVGTQAWGASHYLSIRDINDTFVAFSSLIGTLPGETTTAILNFAAPVTPGTYTYYVQALENGVQFFSTQTTLTLTVLAPLTNSITYNTTTFPVSAAPGSNVVFTYNVTNTGTQAWGANHILSLKDSTPTTISSALLTVLAPGNSKTVNLSFTAPLTPGVYNYTVQASQTGVGDFNSQADLTLTVLAPRPNAIVYTRTRSPDEVVPGATLNLSYQLSNAGTTAWGSGHYVSLRDENGTFLAFIPLNGVAVSGSANVAFSFAAPTTPGLHTFYVQAFEDGIEFFSTQDVVVIQVDALPLANAITYNATTFPATAAPGATVNFTYNITNRGTKTWGSTDFLSFRDVDNTFLGFPSISGVAPNGSKTVNISFSAPTTPGIYTYKAQGLEDGVSFYTMEDTLVLFVP